MSVAPTPVAAPARGRGAGRTLLVVFGSLLALLSAALLLGAIAALALNLGRDGDGFFTTPRHTFSVDSYAITHEPLQLSETPTWVFTDLGLGTVRIEARSDKPVFVGIARERDVDAYLAGVAHDDVDSLHYGPFGVDYRAHEGGAPAAPPTSRSFWEASAAGSGTVVLDWELAKGDWRAVVMNADGSPGVSAGLRFGADTPLLWWVGGGLLALALLLGGGAAAMLVFGLSQPTAAGEGGAAALAAPALSVGVTPYPVKVGGRLDPELSRWRWLVKWFLAIPHYVVLAFLWAALAVLTVVAFFAILFTGRYPRGIFDFNAGVLRWTWRVGFYAWSTLGTDRYPPFSLGPEPDYPATLEIPYPERLSRGLVLVKSWLLAIPHLLVVAVFFGNAGWVTDQWRLDGPSLNGLLVLIAAVVLLVKGRYPREIFDLVLGMNRWGLRVAAYVLLMRDEYPPFRLGD